MSIDIPTISSQIDRNWIYPSHVRVCIKSKKRWRRSRRGRSRKWEREIEIETEHAMNVNIPRDPYKLILIPWRPKTLQSFTCMNHNHISIYQWKITVSGHIWELHSNSLIWLQAGKLPPHCSFMHPWFQSPLSSACWSFLFRLWKRNYDLYVLMISM